MISGWLLFLGTFLCGVLFGIGLTIVGVLVLVQWNERMVE